jgi:benzoate/toluate 1,2-dioxygenase subunit beta
MMLDYGTHRRVERFLFEEARLLDSGELAAWLRLYKPQGVYWMPRQRGLADPLNIASIIQEDHAILSIRVQRLFDARALVLTPMPHTTLFIGNIEAELTAPGSFTAKSTFISIEVQSNPQKLYSGQLTHRLVEYGETFRIALKRVALLNCDGTLALMTFPL